MLKIEEIKDDVIKELEERLAKGEGDADVGCVLASHVNYPVECYRSCNECYLKVFKMLLEKVKYKLTQLEYELLKYLYTNCYTHLFRDENRDLYAKSTINDDVQYLPFKGLFSFVGSEPTQIDDVLNNYEIVEDEEHE